MHKFCGQCGTPRAEGAKFCMTCGSRFEEVHTCPTCGQLWPEGIPLPDGATATSATTTSSEASTTTAPASISPPVEGMYTSPEGAFYFDGSQSWVAVNRGGFYLPDFDQPAPAFNPAASDSVLVSEQSFENVDRPTGPALGPDYVPGRDCGNCGFELGESKDECSRCGSTNTGPTFDPSALN